MHAEVEKSPYVEPAWKRSTTLQALDSRCFYSTSSHYALCTWLAVCFSCTIPGSHVGHVSIWHYHEVLTHDDKSAPNTTPAARMSHYFYIDMRAQATRRETDMQASQEGIAELLTFPLLDE